MKSFDKDNHYCLIFRKFILTFNFFIEFRRDSAIFEQAQMALAAPKIRNVYD